MATAKELRLWATMVRQWAKAIDDMRIAEHADGLAAELDRLAECHEVADRQLV